MDRKWLLIILILLPLFTPSPIFAETVLLKSGKTVEGKIIERTDKYIKISFEGVPLSYFLDEIEAINGEIIKIPPMPEQESHTRLAHNNGISEGPQASAVDKELLDLGINFVPPRGWKKVKFPNIPDSIYFGSPDNNSTIAIEFGQDANIASFNLELMMMRNFKKPISEDKISFLEVPCYIFTMREINKKGIEMKSLLYQFFKNGKVFNILYGADINWFDKYLPEFKKSLDTYQLVQ